MLDRRVIDGIAQAAPKRAAGLREAFTAVQGGTVVFREPGTMLIESFL
jgi:hypothetical protein